MLEILESFWLGLAACLVAGLTTGLLVKRAPARGGVARWLVWSGLAFVTGVAAAALGALAGRAGVYLETALAFFAAFLGGSALGTLMRGGALREHEGWALGFVPAVLIWWIANLSGQTALETKLTRKVAAAMEEAGAGASGVEVRGRDVFAPRETLARADLAAKISAVDGVRRAVALDAAPAETATAEADRKDGGSGKRDEEDAGLGAPPAKPEAKPASEPPPRHDRAGAAAILAALPTKGELDGATCERALAAAGTLDKIQFGRGGVSIRMSSARALDKLAALLRRCPSAKFEVGGHTDNVGAEADNDALSQRRAQRVVDYLVAEGIARGRLTAMGYGAHRPVASNDSEGGRAANRRIEFTLK